MARTIDIGSKTYYAKQTLKWCEKYFGLCDRKKRRLIFRFSERKRKMDNFDIFGNYCFYRNKMTIHEPACITIHDIVATVIHEYTHFKQPIRKKYNQYLEEYGRNYNNHPYEITANNKACRDTVTATEWVFGKIKM